MCRLGIACGGLDEDTLHIAMSPWLKGVYNRGRYSRGVGSLSSKRNEPCGCGSGKKYKKCCMQAPTDSLNAKDLRACVNALTPVLEQFARQHFGDVVFSAAWHNFSRWGVGAIAHEKQLYQSAYKAWCLFSWLPDDQGLKDAQFLTPASDHAIAAEYLKLHQTRLESLEQTVIEKGVTSPHSFYTVLSLAADERLRLQEIYTQKSVMVERDANVDYAVGDVLFGAVLSVDGVSILLGCMPEHLGSASQSRIEAHRQKWESEVGQAIDRRLLYLHDTELRRYYFLLLSKQQQANLH